MTVQTVVVAWVLGIMTSLPLFGPTSVVIFTNGIQGNIRAGRFIALGSGLVECVYAGIAFWGASSVLGQYMDVVMPVAKAVGFIICLALGVPLVKYVHKDPTKDKASKEGSKDAFARSLTLRPLLTGMSLAALNPALIASWAGLSTSVVSAGLLDFDASPAPAFALGVFLGIQTCYTFVLAVVGHYRERLSPRLVTLIMRGTGSVLCLVGVGLGVSAALSYTSAAPATVPLKTAL